MTTGPRIATVWTCPKCGAVRRKSAKLQALSGGALVGAVPQVSCLACHKPLDFHALVSGLYDWQQPGRTMAEDACAEIGAVGGVIAGAWAAVQVHHGHGTLATIGAFVGVFIGCLFAAVLLAAALGPGKPTFPPQPAEDVEIVGPAAAPRPLSGEEKALVEKLVALGRKAPDGRSSSTYLNVGRQGALELGQALYDHGGHELMLRAHEEVVAALGGIAGRELEVCWSGIGQWAG